MKIHGTEVLKSLHDRAFYCLGSSFEISWNDLTPVVFGNENNPEEKNTKKSSLSSSSFTTAKIDNPSTIIQHLQEIDFRTADLNAHPSENDSSSSLQDLLCCPDMKETLDSKIFQSSARMTDSFRVTQALRAASLSNITLGDLDEIVNCIVSIQQQSMRTELENYYLKLNYNNLVYILLHICMNHSVDSNPWKDMRLLLLEMVVHPLGVKRRLAFEMVFNLSFRLCAQYITRYEESSNHQETHERNNVESSPQEEEFITNHSEIQKSLFHITVELVEKVLDESNLDDSQCGKEGQNTDPQSNTVHETPSEYQQTLWLGIHCLLHFLECRDELAADRLLSLSSHIIINIVEFIVESTGCQIGRYESEIEYRVVRIYIFLLYLRQNIENQLLKSSTTTSLSPNSTLKTVKNHALNQSKQRTMNAELNYFDISPSTKNVELPINPTSSSLQPQQMEILSYILFNTFSLRVQRLVFMLLVDIACAKLNSLYCGRDESSEGRQDTNQNTGSQGCHTASSPYNVEIILRFFNSMDVPYFICYSPGLFARKSLSSTVSNIFQNRKRNKYPSNVSNNFSEKQINPKIIIEVLKEIGDLIQLEDVLENQALRAFVLVTRERHNHSSTLSSTRSTYHRTIAPSLVSGNEQIVEKVSSLLASTKPMEVYKGKQWMRDLLDHGVDEFSKNRNVLQNISSSCDASAISNHSEILEETFVLNEELELHEMILGKFYELGRSILPQQRLKFLQILHYFILKRQHSHLLQLVPQEFQNEEHIDILIYCILVIIKFCAVPIDLFHQKDLHRKGERVDEEYTYKFYHRTNLYSTDTVLSLILNGRAAVDIDRITLISVSFFVSSLRKLMVADFENELSSPILKDCIAILALVLIELGKKDQVSAARHLDLIKTFQHCADTRISYMASCFLLGKYKRNKKENYYKSLRELVRKGQQNEVLSTTDTATSISSILLNPHFRFQYIM